MSCTKVDLANKNNHSRMQLFGQISYLQITGTRVNITQTLEVINVQTLMYEPLIDIPNWKLYDLYRKVCSELTILA